MYFHNIRKSKGAVVFGSDVPSGCAGPLGWPTCPFWAPRRTTLWAALWLDLARWTWPAVLGGTQQSVLWTGLWQVQVGTFLARLGKQDTQFSDSLWPLSCCDLLRLLSLLTYLPLLQRT